ncbi:cation diffusion facilitator family transporter [Mobilicoccus caccae]|nr:cation diffusion facilitator family transporter [Mobilicoccus caccae]
MTGERGGHGHGNHNGHGHDHGALVDHRGRLAAVLAITVTVLVVEVVGAIVSGSLALLADAGHMLTDVAGLAMAMVAATLARRPATPFRTWGFVRAEILGAAAQAILLLGVGVFILVESIERLSRPPEVASTAMIVFGVVGLLANVVGMMILAGSRSSNLNMRAAFLEVVNDALGSVAVIVAAIVIATTGFDRADAIASLVIVALIVPRTIRLLRDAVHVLMESTPPGLDLAAVREGILGLHHVRDVHDLHATQVATGIPVLTAHVVVDDGCFRDAHALQLLDAVQARLRDDFDIAHSTIQLEGPTHVGHEYPTHD